VWRACNNSGIDEILTAAECAVFEGDADFGYVARVAPTIILDFAIRALKKVADAEK